MEQYNVILCIPLLDQTSRPEYPTALTSVVSAACEGYSGPKKVGVNPTHQGQQIDHID
jgi:hypothetical protein